MKSYVALLKSMGINSIGQSFYSEYTSRSGSEEVFVLPGTNVQLFTRYRRWTLEPKEPSPLTTPIFKLQFNIIFISTLDFVCLILRLYVPPIQPILSSLICGS